MCGFDVERIQSLFFVLLLSMVDKDAKVREMRRENLLLTSKIQLLEDQMENLNDRVDRTLRERNQLRREINSVRFDSNVSIEVSTLLSFAHPHVCLSSDKFSFNTISFANTWTNHYRLDSTCYSTC